MSMKGLFDMSLSACCFRLCGILILQALIVHNVLAQSLALEAGEKNINIVYNRPVINDASPPLMIEAGLLYTEQNNHQDLFASAGLAAFTHSTNYSGLSFGGGLKIVAADPLDYYLSAIAIGAELVYRPAAPGYRFATSAYYAGESLTFSDGDNVSFVTINMDIGMTSSSFIRLGYRRIQTQSNNGVSADFDRGAYLGLLWLF